jgi:sugar lactone lactonase YvrE
MSRFSAAVRFASILPGVILVAAFCFLSSSAAYAVQPAAPQLLPYTVGIVAGGGTYGVTANKYTVGNYCGTNTSSPPAGTPPAPLTSWPAALSTVGDGCLATQVAITSPNATAVDSEGNVFIVDYTNKLIRRVDAHTDIITTVGGATTTATVTAPASNPVGTVATPAACPYGGQTTTDSWGDGCLATSVLMDNPEAIAIDPSGNIWFTDYALDAVRKINKTTGILSTVVNTAFTAGYNADNVAYTRNGILAANGKIYRAYGLTFDKYGNLYIADNYNNVVDVVNLGSTSTTIAGYTVGAGEIFTIAGSGCPYATSPGCTTSAYYGKTPAAGNSIISTSAMLDSPYQVAVDNSGNIYIADEFNYDIRVINGTTGMLTSFANNTFTRMTNLSRGVALTTTLGNTYGVATDSLGNVYIATYLATSPNWANFIARVDIATGEIYPIAGQHATAVPTADTAQTGATYCGGKTDAIGDGCPGTQATFWKPYFPVLDAAGNIYVTDAGDNLIRKISVGTQFPATIAGTGASVTQSIDVHFGVGDTPLGSSPNYTGAFTFPNPNTFAGFVLGTPACTLNSDNTTDCVLPVTFQPPAGTAGLLTAPLTVTSAAGLVSNFSLTGTALGPVLAVDPGTQGTLASSLTGVNSVAIDLGINVYATVPSINSMVEISPTGSSVSMSFGAITPNAVTVDNAGNIYVAFTSGVIMKLPDGVAANAFQFASGFTTPSGLAVDAYGNLYVSDSAANTVTEILGGTGAQVVLANTTTVPTLSVPTGLAVDSYGNVYVANTNGNDVIEIPFNGSAAITLGSGLSAPQGVAVDAAGSLYIADKGNKRIVFLPNENGTLNSNDQIAIVNTGLGAPTGVAIHYDGTLYVSDSANNMIYQDMRANASINLGNAQTPIGLLSAQTNTASADIISMGNQPAIFGSNFWSWSGAGQSYFGLTPSSIPVSSYFPNAGYGVALTASFTPGATGSWSAAVLYDSTSPANQPGLNLSGTGIQPNDSTTTVINTTVPSGQTNWIYGQSVVVNMVVTVGDGLPAPTGNVSVYIDGNSTPVTAALTPGTVTLTAPTTSTASLSIQGLSAGGHAVYAYYGGDSNSSNSTSSTLNFTIAQAPLTVTVNSLSKQFDAPLPVLTGTLTGTVNGDQIGVTYSTTATQSSPVVVGGYPITAQVTGAAVVNYSVTNNSGTLTILKDTTVTGLGVSATSVNSTTQVILTATVSNQTSYSVVSVPTGSVTFFNTVGTTTTQIGTPQTVNSSGVATLTTTFAVVGASTNNSVTAVYQGDGNFLTSTSAPTVVVSGVPTVVLVSGAGTNSLLTVSPGQSGMMSFTLTPMYGYNGTITFACAGQAPSVTCSFSPASVVSTGTATPVLITVTFNTTAPVVQLSRSQPPSGIIGSGKIPFSLAALPGLALLFGFSRLRRKFLRGYRSLLLFALCLIGLGFSGCGGGKITQGTPVGTENITITATGTGGSFASVTQQFTVSLIVH